MHVPTELDRVVRKKPTPCQAYVSTVQTAEGFVLSSQLQPTQEAKHHNAQIADVLRTQTDAIRTAISDLTGTSGRTLLCLRTCRRAAPHLQHSR